MRKPKTPKVGDTILVNTGSPSNGANFHPALVNCVFSKEMVNATAFPDCGSPESTSSVPHASDLAPDNSPKNSYCWIWPDELDEYDPVG